MLLLPLGDPEPPLASAEESDENFDDTGQKMKIDPYLEQILHILTSSSSGQNQLGKNQLLALIKAIIKW